MPRTILDVSKWQGSIDWDKVKASGLVSGVMIRAMGNSKEGKPSKPYIDHYFARNYAECAYAQLCRKLERGRRCHKSAWC